MDKLDLCWIPFISLLLMTLILSSELIFIVRTTSIIVRGLKKTLECI